jgi:peroxiredoxin (alkyl hydroperoxide reductase subunit C)
MPSTQALAGEKHIQRTGAAPHLSVDGLQRMVIATVVGQNVSEVFTLSNTGTGVLELAIERTSCGCVGAVLSSKNVKPGETATLTFKMQAGGWGSKIESVFLKTNDPAQPQVTLTVEAKMPPTVVPNPPQLTVETAEGETAKRYLSLLLPEGASLNTVEARQPFDSVEVVESQPITNGSMLRVAVSVAASAPPGAFQDELIFHLKNAPVPQIEVPVEGLVKNDVQVEPSQVFFGRIAPGHTTRKTFLVQSRSGKAFQIRAVQASGPAISVQASTTATAASHAVGVVVQSGQAAGSFLQETVRLTLSSGRVLEVPVVGQFVKASGMAAQAGRLAVGSPAPEFAAMDANGNRWTLSALRGRKNLLLTFFPKCFSGGCAQQMASLQEHLQALEAADVQILAVSVDPRDEQRGFAAKLGLQFPLIPDSDRALCLLYSAAQDKADLAARQSVLIDKSGIVRWIDTDVHVSTHGVDVLAKMRELRMVK